jgi:hypothetical protein
MENSVVPCIHVWFDSGMARLKCSGRVKFRIQRARFHCWERNFKLRIRTITNFESSLHALYDCTLSLCYLISF